MPPLALLPVITGAVAASSIAGMAMIGSAVIGTIGMVTGNKTLTTIGTILGIGGGIAAFAGVGTTPLFGGAANTASGASSAANLIGGSGADALNMSNALNPMSGLSGATNTSLASTAGLNAPSPGGLGMAESFMATPAGAGVGTSAVIPPPTAVSGGLIGRIKEMTAALGSEGTGALVKTAGEALASGFGKDPNQERLDAELQMYKERLKRTNNIGLINLGIEANTSANPFSSTPYRSPAVV